MTNPTGADVVIIGAGVSGLSVAYELLQRAGREKRRLDLLCLEAGSRGGGNVRTLHEAGFVCEWGPNGFLDNVPATLDLVRRLALEDRVVRASERAAVRYIYRGGRLRRVPTGAASFLASGILPPGAKLRLLAEPLIPPRRDAADESVFDFASRRIGRRAASILVDAMVSGVYAGDVSRLSLAATFPKMRSMEDEHGGLFRAMLARRKGRAPASAGGPAGPGGTLTSFATGFQELPDALAAALGRHLQLDRPVVTVVDRGDRGYRVLPRDGAPIDTSAVVLASPASQSTALVREMDAELAGPLEQIPSAGLVVVHCGFTEEALGRNVAGFGFLVPRGQGVRSLGTLWSSQIFDGRAPRGRCLLTTMIGGAHDPEALELEERELIAIVRRDLLQTMQIGVAPFFIRLFRHPLGIPQYTLGHLERVARIEARLARHPGLFVSGNSYHGISVNACVEQAPRVAAAVLQFLGPAADGGSGSERPVASQDPTHAAE